MIEKVKKFIDEKLKPTAKKVIAWTKTNGKKVIAWIKVKTVKAVQWAKNNKKIAIIIAASVLVAVLTVVLVCVLRSDTAERDDEDKMCLIENRCGIKKL